MLPTAVKQFIAFSEDIRTTARQMQARIQANQSCFERKTFTSLPPEGHAVELIRPVIEEVQLHGVFLTTENVLKQLIEQYRAGVDECSSDPSRWATLCSFLAMSAHHRTASGSVVGMFSIAWAFFKNAFAMYVELAIVQRPQISTCEALLAMALFMLRTADACVAARLTATVAQSVYMLGLHKYEHYIDLEANVAERQRMIFWVTYVVNADLAHRYGTPSSLDVDNFDIAFPGHVYHHVSDHVDHMIDLIQTEQAIYLRRRAVLAVTQLRIHKVLQQAFSRNAKRKLSDIEDAITAIDNELQAWKNSLPIGIQPGFRSHESPLLEMPIAMLHYIYFSCISKVSMVVVLQTLSFPLSAVLILLSEVLAYPASIQARTDTQLINDFVEYLERLQQEGSDVRDLLDGCKKFYSIAMRAGEQTNTFEQTAEIQLLRSRFSQVTDWLQLAQGLLSNMPAPQNQACEIFSDILGPDTMDETYGAFVPAFMKSSTYNFSFGV
ncbi:hypothetical protein AA0116_g5135 [Alternaria tenuissima]|nr:hypothetical protein AA0116_g5135 [Alternaria tenuissima]